MAEEQNNVQAEAKTFLQKHWKKLVVIGVLIIAVITIFSIGCQLGLSCK